MLIRKAYAKINLSLDVTGRRTNGYHDVDMVMQSIGLFDTLSFEIMEGSGQDGFSPDDHRGTSSVDLSSSLSGGARGAVGAVPLNQMDNQNDEGQRLPHIFLTSDAEGLSLGEDNLIVRAARKMMDAYDLHEDIHIHLEKRIPVAAGMAGGSTDAAAVFLGLNELFRVGASTEELCKMGATLGADIPYCILGGTARAQGIGEVLTPLKACPDFALAIAKPPVGVSTKFVYEELDYVAGWRTRESLKEPEKGGDGAKEGQSDSSNPTITHPDVSGMVAAIERGDRDGILSRLGNVLEEVTLPAYPEVARIKELMLQNGAEASLMSGSGPTVFGIFQTEEMAGAALDKIREAGLAQELFVTHPV